MSFHKSWNWDVWENKRVLLRVYCTAFPGCLCLSRFAGKVNELPSLTSKAHGPLLTLIRWYVGFATWTWLIIYAYWFQWLIVMPVIVMSKYIIRPHRSTTYVDAAYSYRPSTVVCRSVTLVSPTKTAASIELPFGLRTWVGPGNHVLDGVQIPPWEGTNFGGERASHSKV